MARTELTVLAVPETHPGGEVAYAFVAHDIANENAFLLTGREILLIKSTDAGSQDVVITSVADPYGRTQDLTIAVPAGETVALAFLDRGGWMQSDGMLYLDCTVATIAYAVLRLPS